MSDEFLIEEPHGFPDTIALDHGSADYEGQEENMIEYHEDEDRVYVRYGSSESLEALYDWICETKQAYNKAFHAGEYEAAAQLESRIHREKERPGS